jgi:DNA adenine methylase
MQGRFNVPKGTKTSVLLPDDDFQRTADLLSRATLLCCDFEKIIERTRLGDLIFIDPPYTVKHNKNGFLQYNEKIFSYDDQIRLAKAVYEAAKRGAKIIGTNAYHQSVIDLYRNFASVTPLSRHSILSGLREYRGDTQEALILIGLELEDIIVEERARIYNPSVTGQKGSVSIGH